MSFENGDANRRTLPYPVSAIHKFPEESNTIPKSSNVLELTVVQVLHNPLLLLKSGCPNTSDAFIPLVNGDLNSTTRLKPSATHKLPDKSNAAS